MYRVRLRLSLPRLMLFQYYVVFSSIGIPIISTLYWYLLYAYVCKWNGHVTTKSGALYSDGVYYLSFFECSFVSLSRIKIPSVFFEVAMYLQRTYIHTCLVVSCNAVSFSAGTYWNASCCKGFREIIILEVFYLTLLLKPP